MKKRLKKKWIAALLSGDYVQGTKQLRSEDRTKHCCLGVLAEVAGLSISDSGRFILGEEPPTYKAIANLINMPNNGFMLAELWKRNDGGHEFKQFDFIQMAEYIQNNIDET